MRVSGAADTMAKNICSELNYGIAIVA